MLFLTPHPQLSHTGGPRGGQSKNNVWEQCRLFWEDYSLFLGRSGRKSLLTFFFFFKSSWDRKWPEYRMLGNVVALGKLVCTTSTSWTDLTWPFLVQTHSGLCEAMSLLIINAFALFTFFRSSPLCLNYAFLMKCHSVWTQLYNFIQIKYCLQTLKVPYYLYFSCQTQMEYSHILIIKKKKKSSSYPVYSCQRKIFQVLVTSVAFRSALKKKRQTIHLHAQLYALKIIQFK